MSAYKLRIGILRLLDCAPVIVAREQGAFAVAGLATEISVEPSWANIADKLTYNLLDAAVILGPLALAMALGLRGRKTDLRLVAILSREGNAIVIGTKPATARRARRSLQPGRIVTVSPAAMAAALTSSEVDGFCAGAPWGTLATQSGMATVVATSAALAPGQATALCH